MSDICEDMIMKSLIQGQIYSGILKGTTAFLISPPNLDDGPQHVKQVKRPVNPPPRALWHSQLGIPPQLCLWVTQMGW